MSADDSGAQTASTSRLRNIAALEHEVQLLQEIRDGLAGQPTSDEIVDAVAGLIEERQAYLERSRHLS